MALRALLKRQEELGKIIEAAPAKFTKTGDVRRTEKYFQRRLNELEEWLEEFKENNEAILKLPEKSSEKRAYIDQNYYFTIMTIGEQLMETYTKARDAKFPQEKTAEVEESVNNETLNGTKEDDREKIIDKVYYLREKAIQQAVEKLADKHTNIYTDIEIEFDIEKLQDIFRHYMNAYEDKVLIARDEYEVEGLALENEELIFSYEQTLISMKTKLAEARRVRENGPEAPKLQPIRVPRFNGSTQNWVPFFNIFSRVVDENEKLNNVQRLQYLFDSLENEPKRLIQHLEMEDGNYQAAMGILMRRYNDKRRIVNKHLDAIIDQKNVLDDINGLKLLHDLTTESIHALEAQKISMKNLGEVLIVRLLEKKLSSITRRRFEETLTSKREIPSFKQLMEFLEERFMAMENSDEKIIDIKNAVECVICHSGHKIHKCAKFNAMKPAERLEAIKKTNLCRNCLNGTHDTKKCSAPKCIKCKGMHHIALHLDFKKKEDAVQAHTTCNTNYDVLLATAVIKVKNQDGAYITVRATTNGKST